MFKPIINLRHNLSSPRGPPIKKLFMTLSRHARSGVDTLSFSCTDPTTASLNCFAEPEERVMATSVDVEHPVETSGPEKPLDSAVVKALELAAQGGPLPSPTDLDFSSIVRCPGIPPLKWQRFSLAPVKMKITNTGCTAIVSAKWMRERPHLRGGPLFGRYVFSQLHFHWGENDSEGSEHTFAGRRFPMELHAVFFKSRYLTQEAALQENDGLVVVAYCFEIGKACDGLHPVISALRNVRCALSSSKISPRPLSQLIPSFSTDYLVYCGSLLTGTCAHVVTWIILPQPLTLSSQQVAEFRTLTSLDGSPLASNWRKPHPHMGRTVLFASNYTEKEEMRGGESMTTKSVAGSKFGGFESGDSSSPEVTLPGTPQHQTTITRGVSHKTPSSGKKKKKTPMIRRRQRRRKSWKIVEPKHTVLVAEPRTSSEGIASALSDAPASREDDPPRLCPEDGRHIRSTGPEHDSAVLDHLQMFEGTSPRSDIASLSAVLEQLQVFDGTSPRADSIGRSECDEHEKRDWVNFLQNCFDSGSATLTSDSLGRFSEDYADETLIESIERELPPENYFSDSEVASPRAETTVIELLSAAKQCGNQSSSSEEAIHFLEGTQPSCPDSTEGSKVIAEMEESDGIRGLIAVSRLNRNGNPSFMTVSHSSHPPTEVSTKFHDVNERIVQIAEQEEGIAGSPVTIAAGVSALCVGEQYSINQQEDSVVKSNIGNTNTISTTEVKSKGNPEQEHLNKPLNSSFSEHHNVSVISGNILKSSAPNLANSENMRQPLFVDTATMLLHEKEKTYSTTDRVNTDSLIDNASHDIVFPGNDVPSWNNLNAIQKKEILQSAHETLLENLTMQDEAIGFIDNFSPDIFGSASNTEISDPVTEEYLEPFSEDVKRGWQTEDMLSRFVDSQYRMPQNPLVCDEDDILKISSRDTPKGGYTSITEPFNTTLFNSNRFANLANREKILANNSHLSHKTNNYMFLPPSEQHPLLKTATATSSDHCLTANNEISAGHEFPLVKPVNRLHEVASNFDMFLPFPHGSVDQCSRNKEHFATQKKASIGYREKRVPRKQAGKLFARRSISRHRSQTSSKESVLSNDRYSRAHWRSPRKRHWSRKLHSSKRRHEFSNRAGDSFKVLNSEGTSSQNLSLGPFGNRKLFRNSKISCSHCGCGFRLRDVSLHFVPSRGIKSSSALSSSGRGDSEEVIELCASCCAVQKIIKTLANEPPVGGNGDSTNRGMDIVVNAAFIAPGTAVPAKSDRDNGAESSQYQPAQPSQETSSDIHTGNNQTTDSKNNQEQSRVSEATPSVPVTVTDRNEVDALERNKLTTEDDKVPLKDVYVSEAVSGWIMDNNLTAALSDSVSVINKQPVITLHAGKGLEGYELSRKCVNEIHNTDVTSKDIEVLTSDAASRTVEEKADCAQSQLPGSTSPLEFTSVSLIGNIEIPCTEEVSKNFAKWSIEAEDSTTKDEVDKNLPALTTSVVDRLVHSASVEDSEKADISNSTNITARHKEEDSFQVVQSMVEGVLFDENNSESRLQHCEGSLGVSKHEPQTVDLFCKMSFEEYKTESRKSHKEAFISPLLNNSKILDDVPEHSPLNVQTILSTAQAENKSSYNSETSHCIYGCEEKHVSTNVAEKSSEHLTRDIICINSGSNVTDAIAQVPASDHVTDFNKEDEGIRKPDALSNSFPTDENFTMEYNILSKVMFYTALKNLEIQSSNHYLELSNEVSKLEQTGENQYEYCKPNSKVADKMEFLMQDFNKLLEENTTPSERDVMSSIMKPPNENEEVIEIKIKSSRVCPNTSVTDGLQVNATLPSPRNLCYSSVARIKHGRSGSLSQDLTDIRVQQPIVEPGSSSTKQCKEDSVVGSILSLPLPSAELAPVKRLAEEISPIPLSNRGGDICKERNDAIQQRPKMEKLFPVQVVKTRRPSPSGKESYLRNQNNVSASVTKSSRGGGNEERCVKQSIVPESRVKRGLNVGEKGVRRKEPITDDKGNTQRGKRKATEYPCEGTKRPHPATEASLKEKGGCMANSSPDEYRKNNSNRFSTSERMKGNYVGEKGNTQILTHESNLKQQVNTNRLRDSQATVVKNVRKGKDDVVACKFTPATLFTAEYKAKREDDDLGVRPNRSLGRPTANRTAKSSIQQRTVCVGRKINIRNAKRNTVASIPTSEEIKVGDCPLERSSMRRDDTSSISTQLSFPSSRHGKHPPRKLLSAASYRRTQSAATSSSKSNTPANTRAAQSLALESGDKCSLQEDDTTSISTQLSNECPGHGKCAARKRLSAITSRRMQCSTTSPKPNTFANIENVESLTHGSSDKQKGRSQFSQEHEKCIRNKRISPSTKNSPQVNYNADSGAGKNHPLSKGPLKENGDCYTSPHLSSASEAGRKMNFSGPSKSSGSSSQKPKNALVTHTKPIPAQETVIKKQGSSSIEGSQKNRRLSHTSKISAFTSVRVPKQDPRLLEKSVNKDDGSSVSTATSAYGRNHQYRRTPTVTKINSVPINVPVIDKPSRCQSWVIEHYKNNHFDQPSEEMVASETSKTRVKKLKNSSTQCSPERQQPKKTDTGTQLSPDNEMKTAKDTATQISDSSLQGHWTPGSSGSGNRYFSDVAIRSVATQYLSANSSPNIAMKKTAETRVRSTSPRTRLSRNQGGEKNTELPVVDHLGVNTSHLERIKQSPRHRLFRVFSTNSLALGTNTADTEKVMKKLFRGKRSKRHRKPPRQGERLTAVQEAVSQGSQHTSGHVAATQRTLTSPSSGLSVGVEAVPMTDAKTFADPKKRHEYGVAKVLQHYKEVAVFEGDQVFKVYQEETEEKSSHSPSMLSRLRNLWNWGSQR